MRFHSKRLPDRTLKACGPGGGSGCGGIHGMGRSMSQLVYEGRP